MGATSSYWPTPMRATGRPRADTLWVTVNPDERGACLDAILHPRLQKLPNRERSSTAGLHAASLVVIRSNIEGMRQTQSRR